MGFNLISWDIPGLVMSNIAMENDPVEIVDFPMKNGGSFQFVTLNYQRVPWDTRKDGRLW